MRLGGSDNCGTCEFNDILTPEGPGGKREDRLFVCKLRGIQVDAPFWTHCHNHQRRNPLLSERPRGPVWAALSGPLADRALSEGVRAVPELVLPRDLAGRLRAPYCGRARPLDSDAGQCAICGEEAGHTIAVMPDAGERTCFCSVSHYLQWWLRHAPNAERFRNRRSVSSDTLYDDLVEIAAMLSGHEDRGSRYINAGQILDALGGLEGIIVQSGFGFIDLAKVDEVIQQIHAEGDRLSPHLVLILNHMAEMGTSLRSGSLDADTAMLALHGINQHLGDFLAGKAHRLPRRQGVRRSPLI